MLAEPAVNVFNKQPVEAFQDLRLKRIAFWSSFFRNPESEVDFEYEIGISVVNFLSKVEDENGTESTFPVAMIVGGILPLAVGVMVILYLKKKLGKL